MSINMGVLFWNDPLKQLIPVGIVSLLLIPAIMIRRAFQSGPQYQYFRTRQSGPKFYQSRNFWIGAGCVGSLGTVYYVNHLETVPISNRVRFMNTSRRQEVAMGRSAYQEIMHQYGHRILPSSHPTSQFVIKVARKLIAAAGMNHIDWEIHVINDPSLNAFVLPGGKVFVFTGILPIVKDADGMAAVLGHEMAHQIARHSAEKFTWLKVLMASNFFISIFFDPGPLIRSLVINYGVLMPFSRSCESEADHIGLLLMAQACYNPEAAISMWERMGRAQKDAPNEYLSTHPNNRTSNSRRD